MPGIFITKGMQVGLSNIKISLTEDAKILPSPIITLNYDVVPTWINISFNNLVQCMSSFEKRNSIWDNATNLIKAEYLEKTFEYSMQSIMATAIALDALYSKLKEIYPVKSDGGKNKGSRSSNICNIIQHSFKLKNHTVKGLKEQLGVIFALRDIAVHPSAKLKTVYEHPILKTGVEERFIQFDYESAKGILFYCLDLVFKLKTESIQKNNKVTEYISHLNIDLIPIRNKWNEYIKNPNFA